MHNSMFYTYPPNHYVVIGFVIWTKGIQSWSTDHICLHSLTQKQN